MTHVPKVDANACDAPMARPSSSAPSRPPLPAIEHMVSAPNFSTCKAAWDAQARAIVTLIQQYENEHPDDALCLADMVVDIDGQKHCLIGDQR